MTLKTNTKDELTEKVRQILGKKLPIANETDRAETSLCTLSFQSKTDPERHILVDTDRDEIAIDLEDWQSETEWDNVIARITVKSIEELVYIAQAWLSGGNLNNYSNVNKEYQNLSKAKT